MVFEPNSAGFGAIAALEKLHANVFLLDANSSDDQIHRIANDFELNAIVDTKDDVISVAPLSTTGQPTHDASVTILTSGTTGKPKAVKHTWQSLSSSQNVGSKRAVDADVSTTAVRGPASHIAGFC